MKIFLQFLFACSYCVSNSHSFIRVLRINARSETIVRASNLKPIIQSVIYLPVTTVKVAVDSFYTLTDSLGSLSKSLTSYRTSSIDQIGDSVRKSKLLFVENIDNIKSTAKKYSPSALSTDFLVLVRRGIDRCYEFVDGFKSRTQSSKSSGGKKIVSKYITRNPVNDIYSKFERLKESYYQSVDTFTSVLNTGKSTLDRTVSTVQNVTIFVVTLPVTIGTKRDELNRNIMQAQQNFQRLQESSNRVGATIVKIVTLESAKEAYADMQMRKKQFEADFLSFQQRLKSIPFISKSDDVVAVQDSPSDASVTLLQAAVLTGIKKEKKKVKPSVLDNIKLAYSFTVGTASFVFGATSTVVDGATGLYRGVRWLVKKKTPRVVPMESTTFERVGFVKTSSSDMSTLPASLISSHASGKNISETNEDSDHQKLPALAEIEVTAPPSTLSDSDTTNDEEVLLKHEEVIQGDGNEVIRTDDMKDIPGLT